MGNPKKKGGVNLEINKKYPQVCVASAGMAEGLILVGKPVGPSAAKYTRVRKRLWQTVILLCAQNVTFYNYKIKLHFPI